MSAVRDVWPGRPFPLGAMWDGNGTNFSLFSENAEWVELSLFDDEDCIEMRGAGTWNDDHCDATLTYVCECDGTPSAATWCDSQATESCGDCNSPCPTGQTCRNQKCE